MKISIIGTGYVGIVTAAGLAQHGHAVTCVDIRPEIVQSIRRGQPPIHEAGLEEMLSRAVKAGRLDATTDPQAAVLNTDVTFVCVGTPTVTTGMDLTQIRSAAQSVGLALRHKSEDHVVAVKSTVLPGTTEGLVQSTIEAHAGRPVGDGWGLCMNPEFLREGQAVADFLNPDRIVIGAMDPMAAASLLTVYAPCACPKIVTTPRTAEMIKYVSNALLATMISFSNEMANLCAAVHGLDTCEVWRGVHLDRRLTPVGTPSKAAAGITEYLWHGLGFGGSCFPKDVAALRTFAKGLGESTRLLDAVLDINVVQPLKVVSLLERDIDPVGRKVAVLGLAFKPGTDDVRESPALRVVEALSGKGARVVAHDPVAMPEAKRRREFAGVTFAKAWPEALKDADACCVITSWPEYRAIQPSDFRDLMRRPLVIDGRGVFSPELMKAAGVMWRGIGYAEESPYAAQIVS